MAVTVEGGDAASTLDRVEFPDEVHQKIEERLTPGSTLIIADTSINSVSLPKGGDFLVVAKDTAKLPPKALYAPRGHAPDVTTLHRGSPFNLGWGGGR